MAARKKPPIRKKISASIKKSAKPQQNFVPEDFEDFLMQRISLHATKRADALLAELLYNLTPATKSLGYASGFGAGLVLSAKHNKFNTIHPLINALENAGFHSILYRPGRSAVVIDAHHNPDCKHGIDGEMHVFEAGMIAGYLSHATGRRLNVHEKLCAHGKSSACRFVGSEDQQLNHIEGFGGIEEMRREMRNAMSKHREAKVSGEYFSLQIIPFTKEPLRTEMVKLMHQVGKGLPSSKLSAEALRSMAALFDARSVKVKKEGRTTTARIELHPENSSGGYADIVAAFFAGMVHKDGKRMVIDRKPGSDGSYTIEITA
ncbi:MAG: 4-vinyl reductase [Candidatus Micrarchaeota archaeon]|nr:4-vinyl reductase [Candidatus Micrarchaeota archaeon]